MINYYDALFTNDEGLDAYYKYVSDNIVGHSIIELACGTGDILSRLNQKYDVVGIDLDETMIATTLTKFPELKGKVSEGDFLEYTDTKRYDNCVCIGDSLNYILNKEDLMKFVEVSTQLSDHIILDCHHPFRLNEFRNDYYEEGSTDAFDYAYQIEVEGEHLVHVINFLDGTFDAIYQWVFNPEILINAYKEKGYNVKVLTDFDKDGITDEGEKVRLIATKESI